MITKYTQIDGNGNDMISYDEIIRAICTDTNYCEQNISHYTDKDGYIISSKNLENIVSQYIRCSYFELNVHIRAIPAKQNDVIPPTIETRPIPPTIETRQIPPPIVTQSFPTANTYARSFYGVTKEVNMMDCYMNNRDLV